MKNSMQNQKLNTEMNNRTELHNHNILNNNSSNNKKKSLYHHQPCTSNETTETSPSNSNTPEIPSAVEGEEVNEDTAYFRNAEEIKVFIIKSQKTYATVLFILVALSISLAIGGIQITYKREAFETERMRIRELNLSTNATNDALEEAGDNIFLYSNIKLGIESLLTILSFGITITLYYYYRTVFLLKKVRNNYSKGTSFYQASPLFQKFLMEGFICALHVPPVVSGYVHPKFQLLVFIRVYLIGRYLQQKHSLMHSQTTRCMARLGNTELTSMFLVKASFRKYPFQMMMFGYTSFVLMSTYIVWLLEERYSYFDTMWMLIVAMTTVGYGDLYPETILGRIAVSMASLVGILFIAIFCFLASQALILSRTEKRVLSYYESKEMSRRKKASALNVIGMWYKYYAYKEKYLSVSENDLTNIDDNHGGGMAGFNTTQREKEQLTLKEKIKFARLKINMCQEISLWRMLRHDPSGPPVNQDFVIEDMKIMVHNMSENIDRMVQLTNRKEEEHQEKMKKEEVAKGQIQSKYPKTVRSNTSNLSGATNPMRCQEVIPTVKIIPPSVSASHDYYMPQETCETTPLLTSNNVPRPQHSQSKTSNTPNYSATAENVLICRPTTNDSNKKYRHDYNVVQQENLIQDPLYFPAPNSINSVNNDVQYPVQSETPGVPRYPTTSDIREYQENRENRGHDIENHESDDVRFTRPSPRTSKILSEVFSDNPSNGYQDCSPRDRNIMIAFNLMKIQHNILNNAIESMYHKTKHDISDIQRKVNTFARRRFNHCNSRISSETGL